MDIGMLNKLLMGEDVDPVTGQIKRTQFYNEMPTVQGLLNGVSQASQGPPQLPVESTPPTMAPPQGAVPATSAQPARPDFMQSMFQGEEPKNNWLMPVGLGLLQAGAGMAGPYYPGLQAPPWARGAAGLAQGLIQGQQLQKAEQDELLKKIKSFIEIRKAFSQPEVINVDGVKVIRDPATGRMLKTEGSTGTSLAERLAKQMNIPVEDALTLIEERKAAGKPEKDVLTDAALVKKSLTEQLGREPSYTEILGGLNRLKEERRPDKLDKTEVWENQETKQRISYRPGIDPIPPSGFYRVGSTDPSRGELSLTPDAIDAMADRYMIDGTMPGLGLGKAATLARSQVMNRVAAKMKEGGVTPADIKTNQIVSSGLRSEANRLLGQRGPMLAFAKTADKNLDIALDLSEKTTRTGVPVFNSWLLAGRKAIAGEPAVAAFHAATQVAINEFAKVTSSATGGGVTSDTARKEIEEILNTAQTPEQFREVVKTLRMDMGNRVSGYEDSLKRLQDAASQLGKPGSAAAQTKPQVGGASYPMEYNDPKLGKMTRAGFDPATGKPLYRAPDGSIKKVK